KARELAEYALRLDPRCPEACLTKAMVRFAFEHDIDGALNELDDLFEGNPGYAFAKLCQAYVFLAAGRYHEAADSVRQAHELDPLSVVVYLYNRGIVAYFAGEWTDAERFARAAAELAPEF